MTIKEIIDGLKFTVDMFLFDPTTGETYKEPRNDMDKTTIDACNGAIELLEQTRWIPCSERLPEEGGDYLVTICYDLLGKGTVREVRRNFFCILSKKWLYEGDDVIAWMPLPEPYKENEK